jgi:hypothetical protein
VVEFGGHLLCYNFDQDSLSRSILIFYFPALLQRTFAKHFVFISIHRQDEGPEAKLPGYTYPALEGGQSQVVDKSACVHLLAL